MSELSYRRGTEPFMKRGTCARLAALALMALAIAAAGAAPAQPETDALTAKVDRLFETWATENTPGAALAVVRDGEVVYKRGYGTANLEHDVPITPSTVFDIASVSKQFAGLAIAMLVQQGKLSLDDDYRKHLPEMPDFGKTITIRHLLHHTSGIRDWPGTLAVAGWLMEDVISFQQILNMARHQQDLNFDPGDEHLYSNTNYNLLAEIVARVSGQPFREWTDENLFKPLGMTSTHFQDDQDNLIENKAYGYYRDGLAFKRASNNLTAMGSSSLFSTVEDLGKWVLNFETASVGGREAIELMHQQGVLNNGETIDYAFGVSQGEYRGLKIMSHSGAWASFRTVIVRVPEMRFAVIVLSNFAEANPGALARQIGELYLSGGSPGDDEEEIEEAPKPPQVIEVSTEALERVSGHYWFEDAGALRHLYVKDGTLMYSRGGSSESALAPVGENVFRMLDVPVKVEVSFRMSDEGKPEAMIVVVADGEPSVMPAVEPADSSPAALSAYTGTYYSEELDTSYVMQVEDGQLRAKHRRREPIALTPTIQDRFSGDAWFFSQVRFTRDAERNVDGLLVSNGRSRNIRFEKR